MPRIIITAGAATGMERCRQFLKEKNPDAAKRAAQAIKEKFALLEMDPHIGRPYSDTLTLRELVISFGGAGYIALYRYDSKQDSVYVLAFRHQKEVGYF